MIAKDKVLHFIAGLLITLVVFTVGTNWGIFKGLALFISFFVAMSIAWAKEIYDSMGYGVSSRLDFIATVFGSALGVLIIYFFV